MRSPIVTLTSMLTLASFAPTLAVECERVLASHGHIQSEDGAYSNFADSCWLIQPPGATSVTLSFHQFSTEPLYDTLRVFDGDSINADPLTPSEGLSGDTLPAPITSSAGTMMIRFISDFSNTGRGFTFAWTSSDGSVLPPGHCAPDCDPGMQHDEACDDACFNEACGWEGAACSALCNASSGCRRSQVADGTCDPECYNAACSFDSGDCSCDNNITEPFGYRTDTPGPDGGAEHDYDSHVHRCWLLRALPGERISLSFARFDVESHFDTVRIWDGDSATAPALHAPAEGLSGHRAAATAADPRATGLSFVSSGASLLLRFDSDWSVTESGFLFGWTPLSPPPGLCAAGCSAEMMLDAACDPECMNAECEWDKGGCDAAAGGPCDADCPAAMLGNGACDAACFSAQCNWDLRDCECDTVLEAASGFRTDGSLTGDDYASSQSLCWLIRPKRPNVTRVTLSFMRFDTEQGYDALQVLLPLSRRARTPSL